MLSLRFQFSCSGLVLSATIAAVIGNSASMSCGSTPAFFNAGQQLKHLVEAAEQERIARSEAVPTELTAFIEWLQKGDVGRQAIIAAGLEDDPSKPRDVWGSDLVVLSEQSEFVGLGSAGPDRQWLSGQGDDITCRLIMRNGHTEVIIDYGDNNNPPATLYWLSSAGLLAMLIVVVLFYRQRQRLRSG